RRHPLRTPRAWRRPAHPLLVRRVAGSDPGRRRARGCFRAARPPGREMRGADARDRVLARVRAALGERDPAAARARAEAYRAARAQGPRPALASDLASRFMQRARDMESTVERVESFDEIPMRVARYLESLALAPELAAQSRAGVCWPEFAAL